jgi:dipeptidyl aminopeptidase/acylaminoacyl peptidase
VFFPGEGIWGDGIWGVDADGSGLTQLTDQPLIVPRDLEAAVAPTGGSVAYLTASDSQLRGLALNLLKLPEGEIRTLTPLSSPDTEAEPDADPALRPPEPLVAIAYEISLAWSPDGQELAFMAAFEGPSSDLYVYSVEDGSLTRLTDGLSEGIRPSWSPNGKVIVHMGVETLGTGAGYSMSGVWAARADGSGVKSLYDPSASSDETIVGWLSDEAFLVYTMSMSRGGATNLRAVNVESGDVRVLWEGLLNDVALDPQSGVLLLAVGPNAGEPEGLYSVHTDDGSAWRILEDNASKVTWSDEAGLFFALTEHGVLAISSKGDAIDIHVPPGYSGFPVVARGTRDLAWTGSSLWIGSILSTIDDPPRQVYPGPVVKAAWGLAGERLLFFGEEGLYAAQSPYIDLVTVAEGISARSAVWVFR